MTIDVKICGLKNTAVVDAAIDSGARWIGYNFFPKSPRYVDFDPAAALVARGAGRIESVALLVEPDDALVEKIANLVNPDWIQLHGKEDPRRVAQIKAMTGKKIIKAFGISGKDDLDAVTPWLDMTDMLLFDAKPPKGSDLPGGNAVSFDWTILQGYETKRPWMLSGGLGPRNVKRALEISGATAVDVASGVEKTRGEKDPDLIRTFMQEVAQVGGQDLTTEGSGLIL